MTRMRRARDAVSRSTATALLGAGAPTSEYCADFNEAQLVAIWIHGVKTALAPRPDHDITGWCTMDYTLGQALQLGCSSMYRVQVLDRKIDIIGIRPRGTLPGTHQSEDNGTTIEVVPSAPNRPTLNPEQGRIETRRSLDVRDLQGDAEYLWRLWHCRSRGA
jgi:hypothetical protein